MRDRVTVGFAQVGSIGMARPRAARVDALSRHASPHVSRATSTMRANFLSSSSMESGFPMIVLAKPHWVLTHICSMGKYFDAWSIRFLKKSLGSSCGDFVVMSPSTTVFDGGTYFSGGNPPARGESYSKKKASTFSLGKTLSAA